MSRRANSPTKPNPAEFYNSRHKWSFHRCEQKFVPFLAPIDQLFFCVVGINRRLPHIRRLDGSNDTEPPQPDVSAGKLSEPHYLVAVAGSGFQRHSHRVSKSWFGDKFIIRLTEAGRVAGMLQSTGIGFRLCISMPEHPELHKEKRLGLQAFFARFGIPPDHIQIVDPALDSENEVDTFSQYGPPVIIVSNSWHVPRLMLPARFLHYPVIAAPAGQLFAMPRMHGFSGLLPTAETFTYWNVVSTN